MKEISFNEPLLKIFREKILKRESLSRVGLVLAFYRDLNGKSSCIVKKESVINPITHKPEPVNGCGMHLMFNRDSKDAPVSYIREKRDRWKIFVNPSFIELNEEQQNMALAYAASRTYIQDKKTVLEIDNSIDLEMRKRTERLIKFISKIK